MSSRFKDWYHATSDEMRKRHSDRAQKWQRDNPERHKENSKRFYENNRDKIIERVKKWQRDNPERHSEKSKRYYEKNREELLAKKRAKDANNKKERSEYQREYYKRVRKPRREAERAKKAVREEEFQNHFTGKLLTYATQQLIIDSFKEPSALPTKLLADCGKNLNE